MLAVLGLHAWLLRGWQPEPGLMRAPVLSVRQIAVAPPVLPVAAPPQAAPEAPPARPPETRPNVATQALPVPRQADAAAAEAETVVTPPVYATRLPAAATLRFETERRQGGGWAELRWQPTGAGYTLALQGMGGAGLASQGGFDSAGLAPQRHTEVRRGREVRAANFQREAGRITYSGPAIEHPLLPGSQDRLSWLVQLAGVLNAEPALAEPGTRLRMVVAGARGDAEVWTFTVQPRAALEVPAGLVEQPVHLLREPRRPYDTEVQVWLDPAREHLPVQLWLRLRATGEGAEYRLIEAGP